MSLLPILIFNANQSNNHIISLISVVVDEIKTTKKDLINLAV